MSVPTSDAGELDLATAEEPRPQLKPEPTDVAPDPGAQPAEAEPDIRANIGRLIGYVSRQRSLFVPAVVLIIISVSCTAYVPTLTGDIIDIIGTGQEGELGPRTLLLLGLAITLFVTGWIGGRLMQRASQRALRTLRQELFDRVQGLSLSFFDKRPIGELMSRVTNDLTAVDQFMSQNLGQMIQAILTLVMTLVMMLLNDVLMTVVALLVMPLMVFTALAVGRIAGPAFQSLQLELGGANGYAEESLTGDKTIMAYGQEDAAIEQMTELSERARAVGSRAMFSTMVTSPAVVVAQNIGTAVIAMVGSVLAINGRFEFGTVVAFTVYSTQLQGPIQILGRVYTALLSAAAGAARVFEVIDDVPIVVNLPGAKPLDFRGGHVAFDRVDFSYVPGRRVLHDNTFEALPGQKIGLCGPTGAGKSTIMNILTRYYDIDSGRISIDGQDIRDCTLDSLRMTISAVLQEPLLFSDTVMMNLKYAREGATDEECIEACRQANAHDFVMTLPHGYDTVLAERGASLSAGQRQMLTIARAMVAAPKMLILDEATSNVDTRTEKLIQQGLTRLMHGRTSFVIAHRLSTIRDSDQILVIDAGRIVERGTHEGLLAQRGLYHRLYMTQFRGSPMGTD